MDKITLKNMKFYSYHGVLDFEKKDGQYFFIDAEIYFDTSKAGVSDNLEDTVDYSKVFEEIRRITEENSFDLIEKLANEIANSILRNFAQIKSTIIRVRKPDAPIKGSFDYMEVEVKRGVNQSIS
jgi:dihydroneopterin aldolase